MATYLYCVRGRGAEPPDGVRGIDGSLVRSLDAGALVAWVSDLPAQAMDATVDRLRAHDAVCAAALESGDTPLPIRFGQSFADDAAVVRGVRDREATLLDRLHRIAGCVEIRVVVTRGLESDLNEEPPAEAPDPNDADLASLHEGPGTSFLRRLARVGRADIAREGACEGARHAVRAGARALIVDQQRCEATRGMAFFPVLVHRADVDAFRDAVAEILSSQQIGLSVLGPFAPYSFSADA